MLFNYFLLIISHRHKCIRENVIFVSVLLLIEWFTSNNHVCYCVTLLLKSKLYNIKSLTLYNLGIKNLTDKSENSCWMTILILFYITLDSGLYLEANYLSKPPKVHVDIRAQSSKLEPWLMSFTHNPVFVFYLFQQYSCSSLWKTTRIISKKSNATNLWTTNKYLI